MGFCLRFPCFFLLTENGAGPSKSSGGSSESGWTLSTCEALNGLWYWSRLVKSVFVLRSLLLWQSCKRAMQRWHLGRSVLFFQDLVVLWTFWKVARGSKRGSLRIKFKCSCHRRLQPSLRRKWPWRLFKRERVEELWCPLGLLARSFVSTSKNVSGNWSWPRSPERRIGKSKQTGPGIAFQEKLTATSSNWATRFTSALQATSTISQFSFSLNFLGQGMQSKIQTCFNMFQLQGMSEPAALPPPSLRA